MASIKFCDICGSKSSAWHGMSIYEWNEDGRNKTRTGEMDICASCFEKEMARIEELKRSAVRRALQRLDEGGLRG